MIAAPFEQQPADDDECDVEAVKRIAKDILEIVANEGFTEEAFIGLAVAVGKQLAFWYPDHARRIDHLRMMTDSIADFAADPSRKFIH